MLVKKYSIKCQYKQYQYEKYQHKQCKITNISINLPPHEVRKKLKQLVVRNVTC